jgi:hypothetical protein
MTKNKDAKRSGTLALAVPAIALGAMGVGAIAIGALAIGRLVIGRMAVSKLRLDTVEIDALTVGHLRVLEDAARAAKSSRPNGQAHDRNADLSNNWEERLLHLS